MSRMTTRGWKRAGISLAVLGMTLAAAQAESPERTPLRPPAVPLIVCDPYFSLWSFNDRLTDAPTQHWTGRAHYVGLMVRVDGRAFRLMGNQPEGVEAMKQVSVEVLPLRTLYRFEGAGVRVELEFLTPHLPSDLDVFSRPAGYLTCGVTATDGREHAVRLHADHTGELVVDDAGQSVSWKREDFGPVVATRMGADPQKMLAREGDNLRIEWGHLYLAARASDGPQRVIAPAETVRAAFAAGRPYPEQDDAAMPRPAGERWPAAAMSLDFGMVGRRPVERTLVLAYDDQYSVEYFGQRLRPYWRRNGWEAKDLLVAAFRDFESLRRQSVKFDRELMADLERAGGWKYARICALAYRQCWGAQKVAADANGAPLMFSKENFSNGCMATVDVMYPAAPQHLLFSAALTRATLKPIFDYARSPLWKHPFAPHDLGRYPLARGQHYGGQMPVEESANLILMTAALARAEGRADFAVAHWDLLAKWAEYLKEKGMDPESQLCTDDFAGHLAHNVNLSAKAIVALGAFGRLCEMKGDRAGAKTYGDLARRYAAEWMRMADDGGPYRLAFDKPGTWSQKYNLVWDRVLDLGLFPPEVMRREMDHYRKVGNAYGLPLDNRSTYTKLDWILWTATLAPTPADWDMLVDPVYRWLNESPSRVPMSDWYFTDGEGKVRGFRARSVVGGVFMRMLAEPRAWRRWSSRGDDRRLPEWAPFPAAPIR